MRPGWSAAAATLALLVTACAGTTTDRAASPPSPTASTRVLATTATQTSSPGPCGRGGSVSNYSRVIWIWMENRSYSQVIGSTGQAPRLASYARRCALATAYYAVGHPSLPNYLAAV